MIVVSRKSPKSKIVRNVAKCLPNNRLFYGEGKIELSLENSEPWPLYVYEKIK